MSTLSNTTILLLETEILYQASFVFLSFSLSTIGFMVTYFFVLIRLFLFQCNTFEDSNLPTFSKSANFKYEVICKFFRYQPSRAIGRLCKFMICDTYFSSTHWKLSNLIWPTLLFIYWTVYIITILGTYIHSNVSYCFL